jgi:hypothetical protein
MWKFFSLFFLLKRDESILMMVQGVSLFLWKGHLQNDDGRDDD